MILIKISDTGCNVCKYFSQFDSYLAEKYKVEFLEISLNNLGKFPEIYFFVLQNFVDPEGFVDVPLFFLEEGGKILDYFEGKIETEAKQFEAFLLHTLIVE
jgi:hypothetical protein